MTPTNPDDDIRRALHDAVSGVQPYGTFDDIRSRTEKVVPMKRWFLPTIAVAAVMAAIVGGAFWLADDDTSGSADGPAGPSGTPSASVSVEPDGLTERAVPVYYVGETAHGKKLYREFQRTEVLRDLTAAVAIAATRAAVEGAPRDPDFVNPWPDGVKFTDGEFGPDGITLSLSGNVHDRPAGMSQADAELAVEQLIYSAQAGLGEGRVPVQLLIDGKHTDTVLGVPASEPLAAGNPDDVLAPVQVDNPSNGVTVPSTFTVTGRAATFEANVVWELKDGDTVVKQGFTTAQECCTLSPYEFQVEDAPPGTYTLVVHDTDESGQDLPVDQDTKEIIVK